MGTRKTTRITVTTEEVWVVRQSALIAQVWCARCATEVAMAPAAQVAALLGISTRAIYRRVEKEELHGCETPAGRFFICLNSIQALAEDSLPLSAAGDCAGRTQMLNTDKTTGGISMSTSKSKTTLTLSFLGNKNSPLASSLEGYANLTPFSNAAPDIHALVIDSSTASGTDVAATIKTILDAGKPVAIANPTRQQIDSIAQLTGTTVIGQPELIVCKRGADVSGSPSYQTIALSSNPSASGAASNADPEVTENSAPTTGTVLLGPAIAEILGGLTTNSPAARLTGPSRATGTSMADIAEAASVSQLTPPLGATYGVLSQPGSFTYKSVQVPEDKTASGAIQSLNNLVNLEFHVYYVDGEGGTPYYYVILKVTSSFSPGLMLLNNKNSLGYFQDGLGFSLWVYDGNGATITNGMTLVNHSPQNVNSGSVPVEIVLPMTLMVNSGGGKSPQQFTATEATSTALEGWAAEDQISPSAPGWYYHQVETWDPSVNTPATYDDWWKDVYDESDYVKAMPALSYSSLSSEQLAVWRFDASLFKPGTRSLPLQFVYIWSQYYAFLHNPDGCNSGSKHHLYIGNWAAAYFCNFDLGAVAVPTGQ